MHDTYIQSESEWEESNLCYCDKCKKFSFKKRKDTLITQFQVYVKELEGGIEEARKYPLINNGKQDDRITPSSKCLAIWKEISNQCQRRNS